MPPNAPKLEEVSPAVIVDLARHLDDNTMSKSDRKIMDSLFGRRPRTDRRIYSPAEVLSSARGYREFSGALPLALGAQGDDSMDMSEVDAKIAASEARIDAKLAQQAGQFTTAHAELMGQISTMRAELVGQITTASSQITGRLDQAETRMAHVEAQTSGLRYNIWGAAVATVALVVGVLSWGTSVFSNGMNAQGVAQKAVETVTPDIKALNTRYDVLDAKIDGLIKTIVESQKGTQHSMPVPQAPIPKDKQQGQ